MGDYLKLTWAETGGPKVGEVPNMHGFVSKMIVRIIEVQLAGTINYDWQPAGLVASVTARSDLLAN